MMLQFMTLVTKVSVIIIMSKYKSSNLGKKSTKHENPLSFLHNKVQSKGKNHLQYSQQSEVPLQVFGEISKKTCQAFIMITPFYSINYGQVKASLQLLHKKYDKQATLAIIQQTMMANYGIKNIKNLQAIQDDDFWHMTIPKLIQKLLLKLPQMDFVKILYRNASQLVDITREDVLLLLASMFFGIMPRQPHQSLLSFGFLMEFKQDRRGRQLIRREKLKCIMAYFKTIMKNPKIFPEYIRIKRTSSQVKFYLNTENYDHSVPLHPVYIKQDKHIQNYCGSAIMIDFANKRVGGGVLFNPCKREEMFFCAYPQLIAAKIMSQELDDDEVIIVYGARQYAIYRGYDDRFQFQKEAPLIKTSKADTSVIVAIDASDYKSNPHLQFTKEGIRRQINKAVAGMEGAFDQGNQDLPICTSKWGYQNGSDEDLKFIIQWIASSQAKRDMIYLSTNAQKIKQYELLVSQLGELTTSQLLAILDGYVQLRQLAHSKEIKLLQYIKYHV